ncbi:hypothetical protein [Nonomuraea sp. NPDC049400]|uniref:hypothetical protein n=1 Tax=Nonomuraea sp. NPDC049400 TaxID=3364352 RepID=UPI0037AC3D47
MHVEACAYLAGVRGAGRAFNTEKTYAGRIALYLSYCRGHGLDWAGPSLPQLMAMKRWLVDEPMPSRSRKPGAAVRYRSEGTANAIMGTVGEFLSWCSLQGWVPPTVVNTLTQPKFLRYLPAGFDPGEDGQHRTIMARTIKFRVAVPGYECLSDEEIAVLLGLARHDRDRFLITEHQPADQQERPTTQDNHRPPARCARCAPTRRAWPLPGAPPARCSSASPRAATSPGCWSTRAARSATRTAG